MSLKKIIRKLKRFFYKINNDLIIVRVDGGVTSQMFQYYLGYLHSKIGHKVKYEISWFDANGKGKDIDGRLARNFDLLEAFPYLDFPVASKEELDLYYKYFMYKNDPKNFSHLNVKPPACLGYYYDIPGFYTNLKDVFKIDLEILDEENKKLAAEISSCNSLGVHVRRGDMSQTKHYWKTPDVDYFVKAIKMSKEQLECQSFENKKPEKMKVFFFSDEPQWVKEHLAPIMKNEKIDFVIVQLNDSSKGYKDLFLCSFAKGQVASQGSFGKAAFALNKNENKFVILYSYDSLDCELKRQL